jgi:hypothetical protein
VSSPPLLQFRLRTIESAARTQTLRPGFLQSCAESLTERFISEAKTVTSRPPLVCLITFFRNLTKLLVHDTFRSVVLPVRTPYYSRSEAVFEPA